MEDYSDKNLRALIAEMIKVSEATKSVADRANPQSSVVGTDKSYRPSSVLFNMFKRVFTVAGFSALVGAGLIFEKEFTLATLGAAATEAGDFFTAFSKASKSKKGNRIENFLDIMDGDAKVNTYKYLQEINKLNETNESLTAVAVEAAYLEFKKFFGVNIEEPGTEDYAIYAAFMGDNMRDVFTPALFNVENNKFKATDTASNYTKTLDKKIYDMIVSASDPKKDPKVRKSEINVAYNTYKAAIEMGKGPNELGVTSILVMSDTEKGFIRKLVGFVGNTIGGFEEIRQGINSIKDGLSPGDPQATSATPANAPPN